MATRRIPHDLTVVAVPVYFGSMAAEWWWLRRRGTDGGGGLPGPAGAYEPRDSRTSLTMGALSLLSPIVLPRLLRPLALGRGRGRVGPAVAATAVGAAAVAAVADRRVRRARRTPSHGAPVAVATADRDPDATAVPGAGPSAAGRVASVAGVTAVVAGSLSLAATWADRTKPGAVWARARHPDLGTGPAAVALAVLGWDVIYYWHHRLSHECRYLWASHVVHHSSEHYNLSTALRQPVTDSLGTAVPYGLLSLVGLSPGVVETARGVNLLYQFWIHTETIGRLGPAETVLNSPSHHRVHHGSNRRYLDRNHGSILIVWDRLFGTFEPEDEPVVYGLTTNLGTFRTWPVATHEFVALLRDVAGSTGWAERLGYVVRGPGWATRHRAEVAPVAAMAPVAAA